ncbi:lipid A deacylase LpxR family protein [Pseudoxanthomonas sp. SGD-10]|nr:lipid A deacylase LpxR family protein [Pseudoxanthomonas sp. SGD-10]
MLRFSFLLLFSVYFSGVSYSQQPETYRYEFGFISDNDAYLAIKQDQYYTNGLFLYLRKAVNNKEDSRFDKKIWEISAGQKMYNAYSGDVYNPRLIDRPFAGYLYGAFSFHWLLKNENSFRAELQTGVVGPSSLAEEGQHLYHDIFGFYEINGWDYQIADEFGLNLFLNYHHKIYRTENTRNDFSLPVEIRVGNFYSGLKTGILFRTGKLNPFNHSQSTKSNISSKQMDASYNKELYFFLKPSLDIVLHDATISGGLFSEDENQVSFNSKPLVFSQELGVAYAKQRWNLGFSIIFKSKEVESRAKAHQYGIINLGYRFSKASKSP